MPATRDDNSKASKPESRSVEMFSMNQAVAVSGTLCSPPNRIPAALLHLQAPVDARWRNDGCIACAVPEDIHQSGLLRFPRLWPDHASTTKHLRPLNSSPGARRLAHAALWRGALPPVTSRITGSVTPFEGNV